MRTLSSHELLNALQAVLHSDPSVRGQAETYLLEARRSQGCAVALLRIINEPQVDAGLRQLAAVLLRQLINVHWEPSSQGFVPPEVCDEEKAIVRKQLLQHLFSVPDKVCTVLGVCVAAVVKWDYPEEWPDVLPTLLEAVVSDAGNEKGSTLQATGLRTLCLMAEDVTDDQLCLVLQRLLPVLLTGVQQGSMAAASTRLGLELLCTSLKNITEMEKPERRAALAVIRTHLQPLVSTLCNILRLDLRANCTETQALVQEALKVLQALVSCMGKKMQEHLPSVVESVWHVLCAAPAVFEALAFDAPSRGGSSNGGVGTKDGAGAEDAEEDGSATGTLEMMVEQLFELLLALLPFQKFQNFLAEHLGTMVYHAISFLQVTRKQERDWLDDPNCYVAEEDMDAFGVRGSCEALLSELQEIDGLQMTEATHHVVQQRLLEAAQRRSAGVESWWRLREACLFALASQLPRRPGPGTWLPVQSEAPAADAELAGGSRAQLEALLKELLEHDLEPAAVPPFLRARALMVVSRVVGMLTEQQAAALLPLMCSFLGGEYVMAVRLSACCVLPCLLRHVPLETAAPAVEMIFTALLALMGSVDRDVLGLVLEAMEVITRVHGKAATPHVTAVAVRIVEAFPGVANDAPLAEGIRDLLGAFAQAPGALKPMFHACVPLLLQMFQSAALQHDDASSVVVDGVLDLLLSFISAIDLEVTQELYSLLKQPAFCLITEYGDVNVTMTCCTLFQTFLRAAGESILHWGGESEASVPDVYARIASAVLHPGAEARAAVNMAPLALQMLRSLPRHAHVLAPHLLQLCVVKAGLCDLPLLRGRLTMVAIRILVEQDVGTQLRMLQACATPPHMLNPLTSFFTLFTEHPLDVEGPFAIRLSAFFCAKLICSQHSELMAIQVRGRPEVVDGARGPTTRRMARTRGNGTVSKPVPLPLRLMQVLVALLQDCESSKGADWLSMLYGDVSGSEDEEEGDGQEDEGAPRPNSGPGEQVIESLGRGKRDRASMIMSMCNDLEDGDVFWRQDSLFESDLAAATKAMVLDFLKRDSAACLALLQHLNQEEQTFVVSAWELNAPALNARDLNAQ